MNKLCFIGDPGPESLLKTFLKMTPGRLGIWGNLQGTDIIEEADYFAVIDRIPARYADRVSSKKCVFLGAHPESLGGYQDMDSFDALAKFDCKNTLGFLEWWINYDYDYLSNLQPFAKTKVLGTIVSNSSSDSSHKVRREFLSRFCSSHPNVLDIYGRIVPFGSLVSHYKGVCGQKPATHANGDYWSGKEPVYEQYKYMIEFDNVGKYYFSERILDCLLLWSMPIYWGGQSMHLFIPENSFRYLNISGNGADVLEIINSGFYENNISEITKARYILLNELQIWARVHKAIFGVTK